MTHLVFGDIKDDPRIGRKDSKGSTNRRSANFATSGNDGGHPDIDNKQPDSIIKSTAATRLPLKCPFCNSHHVLVRCKDFKKFCAEQRLRGSNTTFCSDKLVETLGVEGEKTWLLLTTLGKQNCMFRCNLFSLEVFDLDENKFAELLSVFSVPSLPGPDLTNNLVGVLICFREEPIAIMADIERMFHQVRVSPKDCDALCFLWWPENDFNKDPEDYQMLVHLFRATSSPSCPSFGLRQAADDNQDMFREEAVRTLRRTFYVDDCLKSIKGETKAISQPPDFNNVTTCYIHHFADASQIPYGAVSYLRITNARGLIHCSFVIGKSRLSPLKHLTIPRLELSAAVAAARLDKIIRSETDIQVVESVLWTDSTCILGYLRNESKRFHTFVANRVATIQEVAAASQWRHVDSSQNLVALLNNSRWLRGPDFLWRPDSSWPIAPSPVLEVSPVDPEVKSTAEVYSQSTEIREEPMNKIFERFSSWYGLKKFIAWILHYRDNLQSAVEQHRSGYTVVTKETKYHHVSGHSGVEHVLSLIREKFWIVGARSAVRRCLNACVPCKRRQAPVGELKMADLPLDRITPDKPPFNYVGVDCFGPFLIRRGRTEGKRYGMLYTCLVVRAVHIEVAHNLDTDSFLNSFRRFVARIGSPELIRSDNGSNFVSGERELNSSIKIGTREKSLISSFRETPSGHSTLHAGPTMAVHGSVA
ncbi:uncharacterized protein [Montipora capricornis]|uniref:uncharacterized protein n=1 Tax=Montipora capricornis TaxID=246305 RepID=UPI0035F1BE57